MLENKKLIIIFGLIASIHLVITTNEYSDENWHEFKDWTEEKETNLESKARDFEAFDSFDTIDHLDEKDDNVIDEWKDWASDKVYKCVGMETIRIENLTSCNNLIQSKIVHLKDFFRHIEEAIENTIYDSEKSKGTQYQYQYWTGSSFNIDNTNNSSYYLDVSEEGWFEMSEISAQIMKDIYEDRVELFVLYDKLKKTEGKWQTYGSKGILGGPNNEHLILSENADHEVLDRKAILSLIRETFSRFSQSFYRHYCFAFHVPNGNDMINAFKLSFALAHKDLSKIALQLSEKTVCRSYKTPKKDSKYKSQEKNSDQDVIDFLEMNKDEPEIEEPLFTFAHVILMLLVLILSIALVISCLYIFKPRKFHELQKLISSFKGFICVKSTKEETNNPAFQRLESESNSDQVDDLNLTEIQANSVYFNANYNGNLESETNFDPSQLITVPGYNSKAKDQVFL